MQAGATVLQLPTDAHRNRLLARLMLKRLEFERAAHSGMLSDAEIVAEDASLTVELFKVAADLGL